MARARMGKARVIVGTSSRAEPGFVRTTGKGRVRLDEGLERRLAEATLAASLGWFEANRAVWVGVDVPAGDHFTLMPSLDAVTHPGWPTSERTDETAPGGRASWSAGAQLAG